MSLAKNSTFQKDRDSGDPEIGHERVDETNLTMISSMFVTRFDITTCHDMSQHVTTSRYEAGAS
jgi:hypothetical protein